MTQTVSDVSALVEELTGNYRVVELSFEVFPGVLKVDNTYKWGRPGRKFEMRQFIAPGPHFMYWIETESHVGTHVEVPSHMYDDEGKCCAEMPLDTFWGEAIVLKFDDLKPRGDDPPYITTEHLKDVKPHDIVLMYSPYSGREMPRLDAAASRHLAELPIKMLGLQNAGMHGKTHDDLMKRDIPIIEQMTHIESLTKDRVLFFGLPLPVRKLDSSMIRAIAFERVG